MPKILPALDATCQKQQGALWGLSLGEGLCCLYPWVFQWSEFDEHLWSQGGMKVIKGKLSCCCGRDMEPIM